jgi:hypothetical protein
VGGHAEVITIGERSITHRALGTWPDRLGEELNKRAPFDAWGLSAMAVSIEEIRRITRFGQIHVLATGPEGPESEPVHRFKSIAASAAALPCENAIIDGEAVVLDDSAHAGFAALQSRPLS